MIFRPMRVAPRIVHSRSQLYYQRTVFEEGANYIIVSGDTYPELFQMTFPGIYAKAPRGWQTKSGSTTKRLWFPPDSLDASEIEAISAWAERFKCYVLIGINRNIESMFTNELDFCMALDFNYSGGTRTPVGEAEYHLKYNCSGISAEKKNEYAKILVYGTLTATDDLPFLPQDALISAIPAEEDGKRKLAWRLARKVAELKGVEFLEATLKCSKGGLKNLPVSEKIPAWEALFAQPGSVEFSQPVAGKVVVIVDDLYQSGATMWCYAKYLKSLGATRVYGLVCVKSLKDSDNQ